MFLISATAFYLQGRPVQVPEGGTAAPLKNEDILTLHSSGLTEAIINATIKVSTCAFDTAPAALTTLKDAGVPESVILEMIACKGPAAAPAPPSNEASATGRTPPPIVGYELSYLKSDRKWKYGLRSEPFNKISDYAEKQLSAALETQGIHRVPTIDSGCCRVVIELLEVTTHPAAVKKPGVDASANLSVRDASNRLVYSKGYRGESRTLLNTWGHLINHAVEDLVKSISEDPDLIRALTTGRGF